MLIKFKQWLLLQPFKRKLQWVIMTVVLTTVVSTLGFLYWEKSQQQRLDFVRTNLALAKLVAEFTVLPLVFDDSKGAEEQLTKLWKDPNVIYVVVEKADGQILTSYDPLNIAAAASPLAGDQEWLWRDHRLYFAVPISHEYEKLGVLKGAYRLDELNQAQYRELRFMLLVMLIAALCSYGIAFILRRFVMTPIKQLEDHARYIAEQPDMREIIEYRVYGQDEISRLFDAFNLLMERIQQRETEILKLNQGLENKIRQRTQDLEESRRILALSLQASNQWLWDWNIAGGVLQLDAELVRLCTPLPPATITINWFNKRIHPDDQVRIKQMQLDLLQGRQHACKVDFRLRTVNGDYRWIHSQGQIIETDPQDRPLRMIGTQIDITERKHAEQYEQFRNHVLEQLASDNSLHYILTELLLGIEQLNPEMLCSILLLDHEGKYFDEVFAPSLPDFYNSAVNGIAIGMGVGSCGTAAFIKERVIVDDIATHPFWAPYKELAAIAGLSSCWSQPIFSSAEQILGTFAIYHTKRRTPTKADIDLIEHSANLACIAIERKRAESGLRIAATVFESQEGMFITDTIGTIVKVNQAFTRITGYNETEVIGQNPQMFKSGQHDESFYRMMWQNIHQTGAWQGEIWNRRKNGDVYPEWLTITGVKGNSDAKVTHYVATLTDITERKVTEERIYQLAFYDPLTQLPNRRLLHERLKHGIELSCRTGNLMAVLILDLDKFKNVNDNFGHTVGDELLQQAATRIKACLREMDTVARLGGDEFVILLEEIECAEYIAKVAINVIDTLGQAFILGENNVYIGASIGISIYPQHGDTVEKLMDNADAALYQAKDLGRGCFAYFSDDLNQKVRTRLAIESRLRKAIVQNEFQVYFQAQIDIVSGKLIGAEALVRWNDSIRGFIMPSDFIGIAENTGLIVPLGEWVLRETCRLGKQWLDQGLPAITLAVNVSPFQFRRCDMSALVSQVLSETGFPASLLELEITESGLMENQQQAQIILNNLHNLGVHLAVDDFGTGYSSLSYLKFFPLDVLKIDKSFIDDIPFLASDIAITSTIIAMAHHLGFKVLAEGVETHEQLAFLQEQGCDLYQGYLYSKPLPASEFIKLLANGQKAIPSV